MGRDFRRQPVRDARDVGRAGDARDRSDVRRRARDWRSLGGEAAAEAGELAGAFAALLYALNLTMVLSDRMVRMFPLLTCAELLQIIFFVRAQGRGMARRVDRLPGYRGFYRDDGPHQLYREFSAGSRSAMARLPATRQAGGIGTRRRGRDFAPGIAVMAGIALLVPFLPGVYCFVA